MITIQSPSMVINDKRAPVSYSMDVTKQVGSSTSIQKIVEMIVNAANATKTKKIQNLILNAHGSPGFLQVGTGLSENTMAPFSSVKDKVFKIWFKGCLVARIIDGNTSKQGDGTALKKLGISSGNGHQFISKFAKLTGCYVVVSTELQGSIHKSYSQGKMDTYEGLVLSYSPEGVISWKKRYPSAYDYNVGENTLTLPTWWE